MVSSTDNREPPSGVGGWLLLLCALLLVGQPVSLGVAATNAVPSLASRGAGVVMLAGFDDPSDYYRRREVALTAATPIGRGLRAELRYAAGEDIPRGLAYERHPFRKDDYRPNPPAKRGNRTTLAPTRNGNIRFVPVA